MGLNLRWLRWLPWKFFIKKMARAHGFLDPVILLSQLQRFTQPSEVNEPIELLRAGAVLHARGLINSRVIQHNLDWVWPYWVEQQFDPTNKSFIPRAFSITHINLTQRNWTAIGLPDYADLPIVDPRGLLTPFLDEWSLDVWLIKQDGAVLLPSRTEGFIQTLCFQSGLDISNESYFEGSILKTTASVRYENNQPTCYLDIEVNTSEDHYLSIVLRPYNPEGINFIHDLVLSKDHTQWIVNNDKAVIFDRPIEWQLLSDYRQGDVYCYLKNKWQAETPDTTFTYHHHCDIGMLTAAALFSVKPKQPNVLQLKIPLLNPIKDKHENSKKKISDNTECLWKQHLSTACKLQIPDSKMKFLYDASLRTLLLHSVDKIYPGPYTYKRFWYRDATFIIYALLCAGLSKRAEQALDYFPKQQDRSGYFHSQQGEWDSNGQALWAFSQFYQFTRRFNPAWQSPINKGIKWLKKKRLSDNPLSPHAGLLPSGFSAEHLGPNDYYYWDDFWALAGLRSISQLGKPLSKKQGGDTHAQDLLVEAELFENAIEKSLVTVQSRLGMAVLPASPYRRLDAGAIGSLTAGYPLQLYAADDPRLLNTAEFLLDNCMVNNGFFQDMIHSGINPYLTLHIAQVLLRAGDSRYFDLMSRVADLASPTGQWPEAIHPHTGGGCMGDGQHVWAAAEWLLMVRNCFVREESGRLILASGIPQAWWQTGERLFFGVAPTQFGPISISVQYKDIYHYDNSHPTLYEQSEFSEKRILIDWQAQWHDQAPMIEIHLPGFSPLIVAAHQSQAVITPILDAL